MQIKAWCDASFDQERKIAGIGIIIQRGEKQRHYALFAPANNINYAELWGVYIAGVLMGGERGVIYTDSLTAKSYACNQVKEKPRTPEQYAEHQRMRLLGYKLRKLPVQVEWTKGHCKYFQENAVNNQMVDLLAKSGRAKYYGR